ncbi:MAG: cyclic nucleotide-binding domain-containing protein [Candidatus Latescibacterota bacterium]|jgi:CRP-like cAMP-binding protein
MSAPAWELFRGLSAAQTAEAMAFGVTIRAAAGQVLFCIGTPADCIYLIERGQVSLTLPLTVGGEEEDVLVEERAAGEALGWSALIPPHRYTLKGTAKVDSDLVSFSRTVLIAWFARQPEVGLVVMRNVAGVTGHRLEVFQTMWAREVQRLVGHRFA